MNNIVDHKNNILFETNNYKNEEEKIIIPQLDFKLWTDFHADERPHHLTKTIMY